MLLMHHSLILQRMFTGVVAAESEEMREFRLARGVRLFGFVPRDVFDGYGREQAAKAVLRAEVSALSPDFVHDFPGHTIMSDHYSHTLYSIRPIRPTPIPGQPDLSDNFLPSFKSPFIARTLWRAHRLLALEKARATLDLCRALPPSAAFAGWIFESYCCHVLSGASDYRGLVDILLPMTPSSRAGGKVLFSTGGLPATPVESSYHLPRRRMLTATAVDFVNPTTKLSEVEYLFLAPTPNNPLFDCFFVQFMFQERRAVIWLVQTTTTQNHKGSGRGYAHVESIREWAEKVLQGELVVDVQVPGDVDDFQDEEEIEPLTGVVGDGDEPEDQQGDTAAIPERQDDADGGQQHSSVAVDSDERAPKKARTDNGIVTELNYVLVCPASPNIPRSWEMPSGWSTAEGKVWCQLVDVAKILGQ